MIKESAFHAGTPGFYPWVGKIPWRRAWQPTPVFLPGASHGQRSLADTVHGVAKSRTGLSTQHSPMANRMSRWPSIRPALLATQEINRELVKTLSPDSDFMGLQTHGNFWKAAQVVLNVKSRLRTSDQIGLSGRFAIMLTTLGADVWGR